MAILATAMPHNIALTVPGDTAETLALQCNMNPRAFVEQFRMRQMAYIRDNLPHTELINEGTWIHVAL